MSEKKQTCESLKKELYRYLELSVEIRGYQLPQMLRDAAVKAFLKKDWHSDTAKEIKYYLEQLEQKGWLEF